MPYPAGGAADITVRMLGQKMAESLGVAVLIDNKPDANGMIGTDVVAKAAPDGYTLLLDASGPLVVPAASPITSVPDLVAAAKAKPGSLSYGSTGVGGGGHLAGELRAFAVSSPKRAKALPQVPTMDELGYKGFSITQFQGFLAPAHTDPAIIARLHQEVVKAMKSADVVQRLEIDGGNDLIGNTPAEFAAQIKSDLTIYRKLIKDADIKQE